MSLYLGFISNSIKKNIIYRFNIWTKLFGKIMYFFVQISVWKALYSTSVISNETGTLENMLMYVTISNIISVIVEFNIIEYLNDVIRNGNIALDLVKPFKYGGYIFCYGFGENIVNFFTQGIPLIVCACFFLKGQISCNGSWFFFGFSLIISLLISFLFAYWIGLLAFFFTVTWPLNMLLKSIYKLLSGMWIPVWLFSDSLRNINRLLPFQYIYYAPASILTATKISSVNVIIGQIIWLLIMIVITKVTWKIGRKRLEVQGG